MFGEGRNHIAQSIDANVIFGSKAIIAALYYFIKTVYKVFMTDTFRVDGYVFNPAKHFGVG